MGNGRRYLEYQRSGKDQLPCRNRAVWNLFPQLKRHQASGCCRLRSELMQNSFILHATLHKRDHSSTGHIGEGSDFESVEDERQGGA